MKTKQFFHILLINTALFILSCGGSSPSPEPPKPPQPPGTPAPDAPTLTAPADNSACIKNTSLTFTWNKAANAVSYQLSVKNLLTQQTTDYTTAELSYTPALTGNTPYSWRVTAINSAGKTASASWKFYLSGAAATNYAPFPAELTAPADGATIAANGAASVQVTLQWKGADPDNDIATYTLYLDNTKAETAAASGLTAATATQTLLSGKTYYWKVETKDKAGNTSLSNVGTFKVN